MLRRTRRSTWVIGVGLVLGAGSVSGQDELVVLNKSAHTANIIDIESGAIVATLPTGRGPHEVIVSRDGQWAVATDYGGRPAGRTLTVLDIPGRRVARTIDLGRYTAPHGIAFLPGDSLVAVTSESTRNVVVVRVADGTIVRAVSTEQGGSHMLAVTADGSRIFTSNGQSGSVSELNPRTGRFVQTFTVPSAPEAITVTPDGAEVWVGSNNRGTVSVLDTESGSIRGALTGFQWPYRILITPDQRRVLIPDLRTHRVRIFDRESLEEVAALDFPGAGPQGIVLAPDGRTVYLSLSRENRVAVIDLESGRVRRYLATGAAPDGIAFIRR